MNLKSVVILLMMAAKTMNYFQMFKQMGQFVKLLGNITYMFNFSVFLIINIFIFALIYYFLGIDVPYFDDH